MKDKKKSLIEKKEDVIKSLKEVEIFLHNWKKASKCVNLFKLLKK